MSWREDLLRGDRSVACLREGPAGCERSAVMCLCDLRRSCRLSLQLVSTLVFLCYEEKDVADGDVRWRWKNWLISQWRHIFQAHFPYFLPDISAIWSPPIHSLPQHLTHFHTFSSMLSTSSKYLQHHTQLTQSVSLQGGKVSREEYRRQKDLEAARKAGTAPAALDEQGNAINPHIPEYITKAPWYADTGHPSLAHQRINEQGPHLKLDEWYDRGAKAGPAAKKYRKGACENCGAMTHRRKDCVERPRKRGAKFTNKDIAPDELVQQFEGDYDAKRDRWNGYDPASYKHVVEEYEATEEMRKRYREEEIDQQTSTDMAAVKKLAKKDKEGKVEDDDDFGSSDEDEDDEDKYADAADQVGQKLDTKTRITVRNLRIREDTAKYLINLDETSAYYDPKTRSMRDAPVRNMNPEDVSDCLFTQV